jgi:ribosome-associated protein
MLDHWSKQGDTMLEATPTIRIPESELAWSFVRSGGPGGQNVNKVASKAVLRWSLAASPSVPDHVKDRFQQLNKRRITAEGEFVVTSQRFRDQERNRLDCLEKLGELIRQAAHLPKPRRPTKPSRGSRERRLQEKRHRSHTKSARQVPEE